MSTVVLSGRPRWQPIIAAALPIFSLLTRVGRAYWRVWIRTLPGRVIAGCQAAGLLITLGTNTYIALIPDPPVGDTSEWWFAAAERIATVQSGVLSWLPLAVVAVIAVTAVYLGWKTANELGTPQRSTTYFGGDQ
ncbi:hypothetical protein ABQE48_13095 [Mycolicibacterium thermoresistibile]